MKKIFSLFFAAIVALVMVSCGPSMRQEFKDLEKAISADDKAKVEEIMGKITKTDDLNTYEAAYYSAGLIATGKYNEAVKCLEDAIARDPETAKKENLESALEMYKSLASMMNK